MNVLSLTSAYPRYDGDPAVPFIESIVTHVAAQGHAMHVVVPEHTEWRRPATRTESNSTRIATHPDAVGLRELGNALEAAA